MNQALVMFPHVQLEVTHENEYLAQRNKVHEASETYRSCSPSDPLGQLLVHVQLAP
jgi:hypothetical protein